MIPAFSKTAIVFIIATGVIYDGINTVNLVFTFNANLLSLFQLIKKLKWLLASTSLTSAIPLD